MQAVSRAGAAWLPPAPLLEAATGQSGTAQRSLQRSALLPSTNDVVGQLSTVPCKKRVGKRSSVTATATVNESAPEPKWKQKLAAADAHQEATRQATAAAKAEYERRQAMARRQSVPKGAVTPLADLPFISYLTEDGKVTDCSDSTAKASLYGIYDEDKKLRYIGITRQVYQSMRLHFARRPLQCYHVKVQHLARPSKALMEGAKDSWIAEIGYTPTGNDGGEEQNLWENPLDCKLLMTDAERKTVEEAAPGPPTYKVLKNVARRVEKELQANFELRNSTENLRFDPKLKDKGLLDLKNTAYVPDSAVPTDAPKAAAPAK